MATWKGRLPVSFTTTLYDADIPYDSDIRYDGLIITNTSWTGRQKKDYLWSSSVQPWQADFQPWLWKYPTRLNGRIIPN